MHPFALCPGFPVPAGHCALVEAEGDHDRLNRAAVGQQSGHREDQLLRFVHPVESGALGLAERPCASLPPVAALFSAPCSGAKNSVL